MIANGDLYAMAAGLLSDVETIFAAPPWGGAAVTLPARRYVSDGQQVAFDCAELVVAANLLWGGYPDSENVAWIPKHAGVPVAVEFTIFLTRCVPKIDMTQGGQPIIPTAAQISASAQTVLQDGVVLFFGILQRHHAGLLFADCDNVLVGRMQSLGPEGGLAGWALPIRTQIGS